MLLHLLSRLNSQNVEFAQFLIEHSTSATAQDKDGWTLLHLVLQSDRPDADLAQFLIEHGADTTVLG
jgi:ankyrin repeat protein